MRMKAGEAGMNLKSSVMLCQNGNWFERHFVSTNNLEKLEIISYILEQAIATIQAGDRWMKSLERITGGNFRLLLKKKNNPRVCVQDY